MSKAKIDKLVRMANQIGEFFAVMPEREAAEGAANHIRKFWTPKMVDEILAHRASGASGLNPTAARAVAVLSPKKQAAS